MKMDKSEMEMNQNEMENGKKKSKSFRLSNEIVEKLKDYAEQSGCKDDSAAIRMLINSAEILNARVTIPEREKEIEGFQTKANDLVSMFLSSLNLNQTTEQRIREEFSDRIIKKDAINEKLSDQISDLKKKNEEEIQKSIDLEDQINAKTDELTAAIKESIRATTEADRIAKVLEDYQVKNAEQKKEIEDLRAFKEINAKLVEDVESARDQLKKEEHAIKKLEGELKNAVDQIDFFKGQLLAIKEEHKAEIESIRNQHKSEISEVKEEARKGITEVREERKSEISDLKVQYAEEIRALREQYVSEMKELKTEIAVDGK